MKILLAILAIITLVFIGYDGYQKQEIGEKQYREIARFSVALTPAVEAAMSDGLITNAEYQHLCRLRNRELVQFNIDWQRKRKGLHVPVPRVLQ